MTKNKETVSSYPNSLETRVALVEMAIVNIISQTLIRFEHKMDSGFHELKNEIRDVESKLKSDIHWIFGIMITGFTLTISGFAAMYAMMGHGFHWF